MNRPPHHVNAERRGDVFCVSLRERRLDEHAVYETADELLSLISDDGCRKLALRLGPEALVCLYSVFLAKLVTVQRKLREHGGALKLYDVPPEVHDVFKACRLHDHFDFAPDEAAAVAALDAL
jgi:anti-anti-sigma factor